MRSARAFSTGANTRARSFLSLAFLELARALFAIVRKFARVFAKLDGNLQRMRGECGDETGVDCRVKAGGEKFELFGGTSRPQLSLAGTCFYARHFATRGIDAARAAGPDDKNTTRTVWLPPICLLRRLAPCPVSPALCTWACWAVTTKRRTAEARAHQTRLHDGSHSASPARLSVSRCISAHK
jgi:hypothetical protein